MATTKNETKVKKSVEIKTDLPNKILIKPLISEKGALIAGQNKYQFEVSATANKGSVKKAIEMVYGVKPTAVNILNTQAKNVKFRGRKGVRYGIKKAIITLPKGITINVYEGV
jgi:large subunit ribosomal protein L23